MVSGPLSTILIGGLEVCIGRGPLAARSHVELGSFPPSSAQSRVAATGGAVSCAAFGNSAGIAMPRAVRAVSFCRAWNGGASTLASMEPLRPAGYSARLCLQGNAKKGPQKQEAPLRGCLKTASFFCGMPQRRLRPGRRAPRMRRVPV